jgi:hypothetical protein
MGFKSFGLTKSGSRVAKNKIDWICVKWNRT